MSIESLDVRYRPARGNTVKTPRPTSLTSSYGCTYDAWNRLVKVYVDVNTNGDYDTGTDTLITLNEYDGLNRRAKKHIDTAAPAAPDGVDT